MVGGRLIGDEMHRELSRNVIRSRRMLCEIVQYGTALFGSAVPIEFAQDGLRTRLVHPPVEHELAAVIRVFRERKDGPAGQHVRKARHVVLGVAGAYAERMQLHDLAREILVQPAAAIDACDGVRTDRVRPDKMH